MCRPVDYIIKNVKSFYIVGGVVLAIAGWLYMMNGIPSRVSKLENDVAELKTAMTQQATKTDMLLQAVYEIRAVLLKK